MLKISRNGTLPLRFLWRHETRVPLVDFRELSSVTSTGEKSETIRARVVEARRIQQVRFRKSANAINSAMSPRQMKVHCQLESEAIVYLEHAIEGMNFSVRAHDRILKVARTLADLSGSPGSHSISWILLSRGRRRG